MSRQRFFLSPRRVTVFQALSTPRRDLRDQRPARDRRAAGLITLCRSVPNDVPVIGITDIQLAHQVHPALTTAAIQTAAVAKLSIESLIRLIQAPHQQPSKVRASTGPRRLK
jgi:DNA-binding LacI/PurR family transcriptional regulator